MTQPRRPFSRFAGVKPKLNPTIIQSVDLGRPPGDNLMSRESILKLAHPVR
jgi:hypothetical protein